MEKHRPKNKVEERIMEVLALRELVPLGELSAILHISKMELWRILQGLEDVVVNEFGIVRFTGNAEEYLGGE